MRRQLNANSKLSDADDEGGFGSDDSVDNKDAKTLMRSAANKNTGAKRKARRNSIAEQLADAVQSRSAREKETAAKVAILDQTLEQRSKIAMAAGSEESFDETEEERRRPVETVVVVVTAGF